MIGFVGETYCTHERLKPELCIIMVQLLLIKKKIHFTLLNLWASPIIRSALIYGEFLRNRQYSLKIFETAVENEKDFIEFFNLHYLLFKDHLILVKGDMSDTIREYLKQKKLHFLHNTTLPAGRSRKALEEEYQMMNNEDMLKENTLLKEQNKSLLYKNLSLNKEFETLSKKFEALSKESSVHQQMSNFEVEKAKSEISKLSHQLENSFTVLDTMIRSGRELEVEGDLLLLNRVNSGATIHTTGNLIVTHVVEGALRCDGHFMMVTVSPKANIIFNGLSVDTSLLEDKLNRIELKENEIVITPVIKKEINWA